MTETASPSMSPNVPPRGSRLGWIKLFVRLLVFAIVAWGIVRTIGKARDDFARQQFSLRQLAPEWLLAAGLTYLAGSVPAWFFWHRILHALGQRPTRGESFRAFFIGHLGKYVPGKALVVLLRAGLVRGPRTDTGVAAASVFIETLTMMATGAMVAAVLLLVGPRQHPGLVWLAIALLGGAGLPTLPPIFRRLVRLLRVARTSPRIDEALGGLTWRLMCVGWACNIVGWAVMGCSLWAALRSIPNVPVTPGDWTVLTACVALAIVAGFASLLPGGMGVREYVVMTLLADPFGSVAAIVSAVLLRVVWLAAEAILAAGLYFVRRPAQ